MRRGETSVRTARETDRLSDVLGDAVVAALSAAADGAFVSDIEGRILSWNAAAEAILGYTEAEALGRPCWTLLAGANDQARTSACKATATFDMAARTKASLGAWINVSVLPVADPRTGTTLIVHLFRDVTVGKEQPALASPNGSATALTRREREVLGLMSDGLNTAAMAKRLHLSRATVRNHVQNILLKLDVHSRLEAVAHGRRHRLL